MPAGQMMRLGWFGQESETWELMISDASLSEYREELRKITNPAAQMTFSQCVKDKETCKAFLEYYKNHWGDNKK